MKYSSALSLLIGLLFALDSQAYVRIATAAGRYPAWKKMPVSYWINEQGSADIINGSEFNAMNAAFNTWQSFSEANVRFDFRGTTKTASAGLDGVNLVTFSDTSLPLGASTVAVTLTFIEEDQDSATISESDIVFNPLYRVATGGESDRFDIQGVLTHEIGHMLGLTHSGLLSSVMSPAAYPGSIGQRVLRNDDVIGAAEIYPGNKSTTAAYTISGIVRSYGNPVFGAHIVAVDEHGSAVISVLTAKDGSYKLPGLAAGNYRVYAEALDYPVSAADLGGSNSLYQDIDTQFDTAYYGNARAFAQARTIQLDRASATSIDIDVLVATTKAINFTVPGAVSYLAVYDHALLVVGGTGVFRDSVFTTSDPKVTVRAVSFGGTQSPIVPTTALLELTVAADATPGPKNIIASRAGSETNLSGVIVVTQLAPVKSQLDPSRISYEGGTLVNLKGGNFRAGARVFVGGMEVTEQTLVDPGLIQFRAPKGAPGAANLIIVNSDGSSVVAPGALTYVAPPPRITSLTPAGGSATTIVDIEGEYFGPQREYVSVKFNGIEASVLASTWTNIRAAVPYGPTSGPVVVSVLGQTAQWPYFAIQEPVPSTNRPAPGYRFVDVPAAPDGSVLSFGESDDAVAFTSLPFPFTLLNDTYLAGSPITISTNGWMSLETTSIAEFQNVRLPAGVSTRPGGGPGVIPPSLIAPFFDDLIVKPGGSVRTQVSGAAPNRRFAVQWSGLSVVDEQDRDLNANLAFEAVLFEGSNDIQFSYKTMQGARSNGSSATIGLQNHNRNVGIQVDSEKVTYSGGGYVFRFNAAAYTIEYADTSRPPKPTIYAGIVYGVNGPTVFATWTASDPESPIIGYRLTADITNGQVYANTDCNSAIPNRFLTVHLVVPTAANFYEPRCPPGNEPIYDYSLVAINAAGLESESVSSQSIKLPEWPEPYRMYFSDLPSNQDQFAGLALLAPIRPASGSIRTLVRAFLPDGNLLSRTGAANPVVVVLNPGDQWSKLISELFGSEPFDGWIEMQTNSLDLKAYGTVGSNDLGKLDGVSVSAGVYDSLLLHPGSEVIIANPNGNPGLVNLTDLETGRTSDVSVRPFGTARITLAGPSRVRTGLPLVITEEVNSGEKLGLNLAVPIASQQSPVVFPHAIAGDGFTTTLRLANVQPVAAIAQLKFAGYSTEIRINPGRSIRFTLNDLIPNGKAAVGAVYIDSRNADGNPLPILGVIDIESEKTLVSLSTYPAAKEFLFPHVAHGNGLFTGLALAAGDEGGTFSIEILKAGSPAYRTSVKLGPHESLARLLSELIPEFKGQNGGYVRVRVEQPAWAWQIYGSDQILASVPPQ